MALHCSKSVHFTPIPFHAYLSLSLYIYIYIYIYISIWYHHVGLLLAYNTQLITSLYPCMHASQQKGLGFAASMQPHPSYSSITKQLHDHGVLPKKQATTRITHCDDFRTACRWKMHPNLIISPSVMSLLLLYLEILGIGCFRFGPSSLLSHFPIVCQGVDVKMNHQGIHTTHLHASRCHHWNYYCYCDVDFVLFIMLHATLVLYYHASMLTLHTSLISRALWLLHTWYCDCVHYHMHTITKSLPTPCPHSHPHEFSWPLQMRF